MKKDDETKNNKVKFGDIVVGQVFSNEKGSCYIKTNSSGSVDLETGFEYSPTANAEYTLHPNASFRLNS